MADNYLENQYENYLARKAAMGAHKKKKNIVRIQRLQPEPLEALEEIIAQPTLQAITWLLPLLNTKPMPGPL